jgi:hypothetical protein
MPIGIATGALKFFARPTGGGRVFFQPHDPRAQRLRRNVPRVAAAGGPVPKPDRDGMFTQQLGQ